MIGVVHGRFFHSPPFISDLLWGALFYPTGINSRCHTSFFTAFVTAWVSAMHQITRSKSTSSKKIPYFVFRSRQSLPFALSYVPGFFFFLIQEIKIAEKKVKITYNFKAADDGWQPTKRDQSASSLRRRLQCIVGNTTDFPDLRTNTSD